MEKEINELIVENMDKVKKQCVPELEVFIGDSVFYKVKLYGRIYYCTHDLIFKESTIELLIKKFKFKEIIFLKNLE